VILTVSDTGAGMGEETIDQIFEPFFTTKEERGAGLGLAIVHGLVQQFGGSIRVVSNKGEGTTFTITLPVVSDTPVSSAERTDNPEQNETPAAILIVDGDMTNRQLLRRLLSDLHRPILAPATAAEAWLIVQRYSGPIALAIIDVTIEDGKTLGPTLREVRADLKLLFLAQNQPIDLGAGEELLREPFEMTDVLRKTRGLVEGRS
jgi:two-component system, cell cycle sensor histidine kinase and response regulator CckA